jgi:hypothetical protein
LIRRIAQRRGDFRDARGEMLGNGVFEDERQLSLE